MFPSYIVENKEFLNKLAKTKSHKKFINLIKNANNEQLLAIVDICHNIVKGNLKLKNIKRKKLSQSKNYYRAVSRSRSAKTAQHRIQTGGNPGLIAAIIAPVLGALAQNLLDKALSKE
jgi:hypothetical protein